MSFTQRKSDKYYRLVLLKRPLERYSLYFLLLLNKFTPENIKSYILTKNPKQNESKIYLIVHRCSLYAVHNS